MRCHLWPWGFMQPHGHTLFRCNMIWIVALTLAAFFFLTRLGIAPYIPSTINGRNDWGINFASLITATPAAYGLTPADATIIQTASDNFDAAFQLAGTIGRVPVSPSTRTQVTVADMIAKMQAAIAIFRPYAQQIRINPGVTDMDKTALGLNLPNNTPSPVPVPTTWPVLSVVNGGYLGLTLRFADSMTPTQLGKKPQGVKQLELVQTIATTPSVDPAVALPAGNYTKIPILLSYDAGDRTKYATLWARWINANRQVGGTVVPAGPWSDPVSAVIM